MAQTEHKVRPKPGPKARPRSRPKARPGPRPKAMARPRSKATPKPSPEPTAKGRPRPGPGQANLQPHAHEQKTNTHKHPEKNGLYSQLHRCDVKCFGIGHTRTPTAYTRARALLAEAPDVLANAKHTTATDDFEAPKYAK